MNQMISVVTPSFNCVKYIKQCIDSVETQSEFVLEHLIWDAESNDGTVEIIQQSAHDKLRLIVKKDLGQSDALNKLINLARGDILLWLNADDMLAKNIFLFIKDELTNPTWDVMYGDFEEIGEDGSVKKMHRLTEFSFLYLSHMGCYIPSSGTFFRRSSLLRLGTPLDCSLKYCMDYDLFFRLANLNSQFLYVKRVFSKFRVHSASISVNVFEQQEEKRVIQTRYGVRIYGGGWGNVAMRVRMLSIRFIFKIHALVYEIIRKS